MVAIVQQRGSKEYSSTATVDSVVVSCDGNQLEVDTSWFFHYHRDHEHDILLWLTRIGKEHVFRDGDRVLFHFTGEMEDVKLVERERVEELIALEAVFYGHPGRLVVSRTEMVAKIDGVTLTSPVTGITLENGVPTLRLEGVLEGHRIALIVPHPR